MKTTVFLLAVLALLGVMVASSPALAGTINTNTTTLGSQSFGFAATQADLATFTRQSAPGSTYVTAVAVGATGVTTATIGTQAVVGNGLVCTGLPGSLTCQDGDGNGPLGYLPIANSLPGALTSRPDKVVSAYTDYGCGILVFGVGAGCVENSNATLTVKGINTMSREIADGQNTAPFDTTLIHATTCPATLTCAADGVLTGVLNSVVTLENQGDPEMPSGSIVFNWTPGVIAGVGLADPTNGSATFEQTLNHAVNGLYTFSEHDITLNPVLTYASRDYGDLADAGGPVGTLHLADRFPRTDSIAVRTTLDLTQTTMGGTGLNTETIGYTVDWTDATFGHPGGNYFTPGLNIRDWAGNETPVPLPSPPGDGLGFAN